MESRAFLVHAITPLHSGTGHSADLVDLPIARMKASNIPYVPGSSIKGVLRSTPELDAEVVKETFGPDTQAAHEHAGALVVGDARLLAMPVRSMIGTFAWVSSPLLLHLAARDLGRDLALPKLDGKTRAVRHAASCVCTHEGKVFLEDLDLPCQHDRHVDTWASLLAKHVCPDTTSLFTQRFVVVDDETMTFLLETATQVDARVRIDAKTGTVAPGALWLEESLPAESLLIGIMTAERSRGGRPMEAREVLDVVLTRTPRAIQLGGKSSVGRGRCRLMEVA